MIKNTTLLVLLCAIVLGGAVYYFNTRQAKDTKTSDTPVTLFSLQLLLDVNRIEVAHPAKPGDPAMRFDKTNSGWQITQPLQTGADEAAVEGIVDQLAAVSSSETEPGTPDRLKAYGLDPAAVSLRVRLRNGTEHTILMGDKDFAGSAVYAVVDGGKTVALLPQLLLTSTDKSADDLRDKTVLPMASDQVASFSLKNGASELAAAKVKDQWRFSKPEDALADQDGIQALLSAVETAKMAAIVSEKPDNLSKYGLASPAATFTATNDVGKTATLAVGQKKGDTYYARDLARLRRFSPSTTTCICSSRKLFRICATRRWRISIPRILHTPRFTTTTERLWRTARRMVRGRSSRRDRKRARRRPLQRYSIRSRRCARKRWWIVRRGMCRRCWRSHSGGVRFER